MDTRNVPLQDLYIFKNGKPVVMVDLLEWAKWMAGTNRVVTASGTEEGPCVVTIFLGLDYQFGSVKPRKPLLFLTVIAGGPHDGEARLTSDVSAAYMAQAEMERKAFSKKEEIR